MCLLGGTERGRRVMRERGKLRCDLERRTENEKRTAGERMEEMAREE